LHTPADVPWRCRPSQPTHRVEQVSRHRLQRVLGETSRDPLSVDLAAYSREWESQDGPAVWEAEAPGASAPMRLVPEDPLLAPARRRCACVDSHIYSWEGTSRRKFSAHVSSSQGFRSEQQPRAGS